MNESRCCSACGGSFPATAEFFVIVNKRHGHRGSLAAECRTCRNSRFRKWYSENREAQIARAIADKRERRKDPEYLERDRKWSRESARRRFANKEERAKATARGRKWYKDNPGRWKTFKHQQPHMKRMSTARRFAAELQATPPWLTADHKRQIETIYAIADYLTRETGVPHDVDHYYPLRALTCCGLHVPWNLRVIPQSANQTKGNRLPI